jgi:two-component system KDP operon response regulator KdpE
VGGRVIDLTPTEQAIFYTLLRHAGKVVPRKHLFRCVWGAEGENKLHDLHVYIANLRHKLRDSHQVLIQTEGRAGYCLTVTGSKSLEAAMPA